MSRWPTPCAISIDKIKFRNRPLAAPEVMVLICKFWFISLRFDQAVECWLFPQDMIRWCNLDPSTRMVPGSPALYASINMHSAEQRLSHPSLAWQVRQAGGL